MIDYFILLLIPLIAFALRSFLLKKKILVNLSGDLHQKFTNQKKFISRRIVNFCLFFIPVFI